ncbi:hypothetical protein BY457_11021 [Marinilabilia salmonicolor]|jgi:hypothetical protein|nr:hypothetical protein BY457_11021 [Marinilabilia salmonicolor]
MRSFKAKNLVRIKPQHILKIQLVKKEDRRLVKMLA